MTYLVDHPTDFRGAFARLRREFRTLYFSAFQSHLWNLMLARWIEHRRAAAERVVIELKTGRFPFPRGLTSEQVRASAERPLPLPSSREPLPAGPLGEVIQEVLNGFQLEWTGLRVKHLKDVFFSKGSRPCLTFPEISRARDNRRRPSSGSSCHAPVVRALEGLLRDDHGQTDHRCRGWVAMNLDVLYEDNHCLVVNKPAGLLSQGDATGDPSLVDLARALPQDRYQKPGNVYVGFLHRLDRPTSGVVLLAKTSKAAGRLSAQFRQGTISKVYWAIVEGDAREKEGEWVDLLEKDTRQNRSGVVPRRAASSKEARVAFRVLERWEEIDQTRAAAGDGPKPSASRPAREEGTYRSLATEIWRDDAAKGTRRPCQDRAARAALTFTHPTRPEAISVDAPVPADWPELSRGGRE